MTCELMRRRTVRTADAIQGLEACDGGDGEGHEDIVDLGDVDLAPDALVRLDNLHAGEAAEGHGLANDGECGRYHGLRSNAQRSNGKARTQNRQLSVAQSHASTLRSMQLHV